MRREAWCTQLHLEGEGRSEGADRPGSATLAVMTGDALGLLNLDLSTSLPLPNGEGGVGLRVESDELEFCSAAAFNSTVHLFPKDIKSVNLWCWELHKDYKLAHFPSLIFPYYKPSSQMFWQPGDSMQLERNIPRYAMR